MRDFKEYIYVRPSENKKKFWLDILLPDGSYVTEYIGNLDLVAHQIICEMRYGGINGLD